MMPRKALLQVLKILKNERKFFTMKHIINLTFQFFLVFTLNSCSLFLGSGNKLIVNEKEKLVKRESGSIINLIIAGPEGSAHLSLKKDQSNNIFYLLKPTPLYNVNIIGDICCLDNGLFHFTPKLGNNYRIEHSSNGDAASYIIEVVFDSQNNMSVVPK